jgi:ribonuclease-3
MVKKVLPIELIEEKLKYSFYKKDLLQLAFTHRSFVNENKESVKEHNERLEFLGDSVLGLLISEFLYNLAPTLKEGDLSYLRSRLVDASTCFSLLQKLEVEGYLLLGKGEMMNAGKGRETLLADLFEAILGAIYLDGGFEKVKAFFFDHFDQIVYEIIKQPVKNWKALLQDHYQKKMQKQPHYKVLFEEGPHHEKVFCVGVFLDEMELGVGRGFSKKEAEQSAAQEAYKKLT